MDIYYIDGQFVPANQAVVSVNDLALLRGYGVFDFLRTYNKRPFRLDAHVNRLIRSAGKISLKIPWPHEEIVDIVMQTLHRNTHDESNIRILVTGGESPDGMLPSGNSKLMVMVSPVRIMPSSWYEEGVKIATTRIQRLFPEAKSISYIAGIHALETAKQKGAVESLYIGQNNQVLECTTSNFFGVMGNRLVTPDTGILPGITRQVIFDLAAGVFKMETRRITVDELKHLDEAFITSSNKEVLPVVQIDDLVIGNRQPGVVTRKIMALFAKLAADYGRSLQ